MKSRNYTTVKVPRVGAFLEYLELTYDVSCRTFNLGSLIVSLECKTLKGLDKLWNDYLSDHLNKVAKKHLVTDEMMKNLSLKTINLMTTIDEENYLNCRKILVESSGEYKLILSRCVIIQWNPDITICQGSSGIRSLYRGIVISRLTYFHCIENLGDYPTVCKKTILLPLFQTIQVISAKFAICSLEYIDLVYFSLFFLLSFDSCIHLDTCLL